MPPEQNAQVRQADSDVRMVAADQLSLSRQSLPVERLRLVVLALLTQQHGKVVV